MDQHDDFDSVSWRQDPDSDVSRPTTSDTDADFSPKFGHDVNGKRRMSSGHEEPQAGPLADAVDLGGVGDGVLECRVDSPLKENDGTKDAYISYLVTTHVSCFHSFGDALQSSRPVVLTNEPDRFQVIPETRFRDPQAVHRFLLLV
jgi:sorting nexin-4